MRGAHDPTSGLGVEGRLRAPREGVVWQEAFRWSREREEDVEKGSVPGERKRKRGVEGIQKGVEGREIKSVARDIWLVC